MRLNCDAFFSIGVSLNTDDMQVNLVNFCGETLVQESLPFAPICRLKTQQWLKTLIETWQKIFLSQQDRIVGIGFAMTGYFVKEKGWIRPQCRYPIGRMLIWSRNWKPYSIFR
ncbi:hypothetical protein P4S72_21470 [Vibrio sp. PP-XX7]